MSGRFLKAAAAASVLLSGFCQAQRDTFTRPNEDVECGTDVDFLAYGEALGLECTAEECEYKEKAGTLFDIKYRQGYKMIEYTSSPELEGTPLNSATYILHQCGSPKPNDDLIKSIIKANASDVQFVEIPLTAVATEDSVVGWMLEELGVLDRVRYAGPFGTSPCMQMIAAEKVAPVVGEDTRDSCDRQFVGEYADPGTPKTKASDIDANFGYTSDAATKQIYMQASADPGPLARAEHIVYLSAFFNAEERGIQYFENVSDSYNKKSNSVEVGDAPTVAWISVYPDASTSFMMTPEGEPLGKGVAAVLSFARYKTLLTTDAGGDLPSQTAIANTTGAFANLDDIVIAQSEIGTRAETLKALHSALKGVDILVDETYQAVPASAKVGDLIKAIGLGGPNVNKAQYPFLANQNIWRHDKAQTESMSDDWFGEAVARPDIVHSDLKEIITPGSVPNHTFKFFRNFSKDDNITVAGPGECTEITCRSYANQAPIVVEVSEGEGESSRGHALVAGVVTACAMMAAML